MSFERIIIAGGPRTGKSTFAKMIAATNGTVARCTDSLNVGYTESYPIVSEWFNAPGPWVIEGVSVTGALRHFLTYNNGAPADKLFWSPTARVELNPKQIGMTKGIDTIWSQIVAKLQARGVGIHYL